MKYYKLLNQCGYRKVNKNKIYPETTVTGDYDVSQLVIDYPYDWKEVCGFEYLFQEGCRLAKEITEKMPPIPKFESGGFTNINIKDNPIVDKNNNKMTYETKIKLLNQLNEDLIETSNGIQIDRDSPYDRVLKYAINQLSQCEVWDEGVTMEVNDWINKDRWSKATVIGKFKDMYVHECKHITDDEIEVSPNARPIKKEPLSFTDFCNKKLGLQIQDFDNSRVNNSVRDYLEYLKQFKP